MRTVTKIQTFDGVLHDSVVDAKRHLDRIYGDKISKLASQLARIDKYSATQDFIDTNLSDFTDLAKIKKDFELVGDDDD